MKDISMHIMDIVQNSIVAEATLVHLHIDQSGAEDLLLRIEDNGKGIDADMLAKVEDPYTTSRTTRKVGLGIPLLKQNTERTGGWFKIQSQLGKGTRLQACFKAQHYDCLPMGDIAGTLVLLIAANPQIDFIYEHKKNKGSYYFSTQEVKAVLEDVPVNNPEIMQYVKQMIQEAEFT